GRYAQLRHEHAGGRLAGLPEHVDWHAAARIPEAGDAQPVRREQLVERLADADRAFLVEAAVVAEACEIKFERLRLEEPPARGVVDDEEREVRLPGDRAEHGELRRREARDVTGVRVRIGDAIERREVRRRRNARGPAEMLELTRLLLGHDLFRKPVPTFRD